ncbi:MAG: S8 family serine peptidase [Sphingorhabdus sp.]
MIKGIFIIPALLSATPVLAEIKIIRSEADLPTKRYAYPEMPSGSFLGDRFGEEVMPIIRHDAESLLANSKIEDPSIAAQLFTGLAAIAILEKRSKDARAFIRDARAAAPKPQTKSIGYFLRDAAAIIDSDGCEAAAKIVRDTLKGTDAALVRDDVLQGYGVVQSVSPGYHAASLAIGFDAEAKAQNSLDLLGALAIARVRMEAIYYPKCRSEVTLAIREWLDDPRNRSTDIWRDRAVPPAALADAHPVTVAIWEAGFDATAFAGQLAFDPAEPLDGRDNDGNGIVDDAFGPTFDPYLRPTARTNQPMTNALAKRLPLQLALMKGELDLGYGDDTPEARLFAQRSREATPAEQIEDALTYQEVRGLSHATWVSSIIADNAPFVRLYNLQAVPFGDDPEPVPLDEASMARWEAVLLAAVSRAREAGVRIVNMSWGSNADEVAQKLRARGLETDPEKARTRAAAIQRRVVALLEKVFRASPDMLFIASAGNSNQSDHILAAAPSDMREPNLLIVGATGISGKPTTFTTFGNNVRLYALGEGNAIRGLGGMRMRASGTSFAAPETVRAAANMLAANPKLTTTQLINGLVSTATKSTQGLLLIHPHNAFLWARDQQ